jgi:hypothetical protein
MTSRGYDLRSVVNYARNTGKLPDTYMGWETYNRGLHEVRRALLKIDKPWGDDFYPRLRRYVLAHREYSNPRLP